ncbi:MAG: SNF2-related protein [Planctomycetaceae bacterium]|nr:SNF2-related protein [Planctomycetaceae bacterium]
MPHDDFKVPNIRRRPDRVSQEQWERFVVGLFPKLTTTTHQLVPVASGSAAMQFDVVPMLPGDHSSPAQHDVQRAVHRVVLRGDRHADMRGDSHCTCPAFRYGVYGTCSHLLFARSQCDGSISNLPIPTYSEIFVRHGLKREIVFRPAPDAPRIVLKAARSCFDARGLLSFERHPALKTLIERTADCRHELRIDNDVFARLAFEMQQRERHRKIMTMFRRGVHSSAFDSLLTTPLAAYQREAALNAAVTGRFLLFDSPGLGRRRTAVAAAEILAQTVGVQRVFVLTNTPTLHTWLAELQQSTSRQSQVIFGSSAKRAGRYNADVQYSVACYDDLKDDLAVITGRMKPGLIILDETHTLKRHGAETARIVRRLESEYLFILSGAAPARVPGPFVSFVDMIDRHRTGLLDNFLARHQQFDLRNNSVSYANMGNVANTLPQHFRRFESSEYRRSLPELITHDRFLPLTETQAKRHADLQNRLFHLASGFGLQKRRQASEVGFQESDSELLPEVRSLKSEAFVALHEIQATIAEMLRVANDMICCRPEIGNLPGGNLTVGCKIDTMFDLLQEHLESPQVKAVVFAHDVKLLQSARAKLAGSPVECGLIDRYMPAYEQKDANMRFQREPNCRVVFVSDGAASRLVFRNVQLVIHLDFPWDADRIRQRQTHIEPHPVLRPCHAYQLISYGTVEHWLAKLRGGHELFIESDLRDGHSVVLLDEPNRVQFIEHVLTMLEQVKEPPMVIPAG